MFLTVGFLTLCQEKVFANNNPKANICFNKSFIKAKECSFEIKIALKVFINRTQASNSSIPIIRIGSC